MEYNSQDLIKQTHTPYDEQRGPSPYGGTQITFLDEGRGFARIQDVGGSMIDVEVATDGLWTVTLRIFPDRLDIYAAAAIVESVVASVTADEAMEAVAARAAV